MTLYRQHYCAYCDQRIAVDGHADWCYGNGKVRRSLLRRAVFNRDGWTCLYCGSEGGRWSLHMDHVRPRSKGGEDAIWNLVTACQTCNLRKGRGIKKWLAGWEAERSQYEAAVEADLIDEFQDAREFEATF